MLRDGHKTQIPIDHLNRRKVLLNGVEIEHTNMRDVFLARTALGDKPLLICDGETLTYADADERSNRVASTLIEYGVGKGDVVRG